MAAEGPITYLFMSQPPILPPDPDEKVWYGNIQYLLNISAVGAVSCVLVFLLVKLRYDHGRFPGPSALLAKLLAVYHATATQIALHCGADASQFLHIERGSFVVLLSVSAVAMFGALPLNIYGGNVPIGDQFAMTTISHIGKGSSLLWVHFCFMLLIVGIAQFGISMIEENLRVTRFRDGNGNPNDPNANSIAIFTIMIQGIPKVIAADKAPLEGYFHHRYPGKVYRVVVPFDLCALDRLVLEWERVKNEIARLQTRVDSEDLWNDQDYHVDRTNENSILSWIKISIKRIKVALGFTDEERLAKLHSLKWRLAGELLSYREGQAQGGGIAFVIFKDVWTASQAVKDLRSERKRTSIGRFFSLMELQLERRRWRVERAPPASDIYWNHLGSSKFSLKLRRVAVNTCLLLMLLFCSSPLALITAAKSAARIINAEALDSAQLWLVWLEGSSWLMAVFLQFLPNVLIFISMYIVIPSALSYLSKFEQHLTVSGEQRAALLKMVWFFLVNLILLRAMVESSLENAILRMGRCYLGGEDCKKIEQYMSGTFLSKSCLSSLAFLIACTFLGISFDLLAPIPWIKNALNKYTKNDMLQLVPENDEEYPLEHSNGDDTLRMPLILERESSPALNAVDLQGQDLSIYPINRSFHIPKQTFDFVQYYGFNLTIFALTLIYSLFAPLVVPVGAVYFGYRYVVDKYNFLFVYRVRGFPSGNDGKLMDRVLCIMQFCVLLFLMSMLLFFSVHGDSTKLQAIFTLGLLIFYKLFPSKSEGVQPSLLEGLQTVDNFVDGPTDYEVFSKPMFDWDTYEV